MASIPNEFAFAADLVRASSFEDLAQRVYAGIGSVVGPVMVGLDLLDPDTGDVRSTSASGASAFFLARYDKLARRRDPVLKFAIDNRVVAHNLSMMTPAEWRASEIYEDVFALHRMTSVVYAPVIVDDRVVATLNLGIEEGFGAFTGAQLDSIEGLAALLSAVLGSLRRTEGFARRAEQFAAAVDLCEEPIVVSDMAEGTRHVNPAAGAVLGSISAGAPGLDQHLALHDDHPRGGDPASSGLVKRSIALDKAGGLVTFLQSRSDAEALPGWVLVRLTPREADVARLAALGLRDTEIAARLMLSLHTVKGYLRDAYRKLEVRSRVELTLLASEA